MGINLLIAGSRDFDDYDFLEKVVNELNLDIDYIISGTARGADKLGEKYAQNHGIKIMQFPADWDRYGKRAGYIRNERMGEECNLALIFWNGESNGTRNMMNILNNLGRGYTLYTYKAKSRL